MEDAGARDSVEKPPVTEQSEVSELARDAWGPSATPVADTLGRRDPEQKELSSQGFPVVDFVDSGNAAKSEGERGHGTQPNRDLAQETNNSLTQKGYEQLPEKPKNAEPGKGQLTDGPVKRPQDRPGQPDTGVKRTPGDDVRSKFGKEPEPSSKPRFEF